MGKTKDEYAPYNTLDMRVIAHALKYRDKAAKLRDKADKMEVSPANQAMWAATHMLANQIEKVSEDMWDMLEAQEKDDEKHGHESPTNIDGRMNK